MKGGGGQRAVGSGQLVTTASPLTAELARMAPC